MPGADKQALDAVFKEVYEEGVSEGVHNKNPLRDLIKTERVPFKGLEVVKLMHILACLGHLRNDDRPGGGALLTGFR